MFSSSWGCLKSKLMFNNINNYFKSSEVLNAMWYGGLDPGGEKKKDVSEKRDKIQVKPVV